VADALFSEPRLAELYDPLDADRRDLDAYLAMAGEFDAATVVDIGCGTGTLACLMAQRGLTVTGVDPAAASLEVARRKRGADPCSLAARRCHGGAPARGRPGDHDRERGPGLRDRP
jgi:SAM-dependent methyltransferase